MRAANFERLFTRTSGLNFLIEEDVSMQRSEGPAYPGRPVGGIPPEVSWMTEAAAAVAGRSSAFDPTNERGPVADNATSKLNR